MAYDYEPEVVAETEPEVAVEESEIFSAESAPAVEEVAVVEPTPVVEEVVAPAPTTTKKSKKVAEPKPEPETVVETPKVANPARVRSGMVVAHSRRVK